MADAESSDRVRFHALGSIGLNRAGSGELRALLVQPKRLALFSYLVLATPPRLHQRDSLLALFWPESSEEQARRALRQALHFLRKTVGPDLIVSRGDDEVGVDASSVWCDVREFDRGLDAGRLEEALTLYRGPLLEGFHISGASAELEQWVEDERSRLRDRAVRAALSLAEQAERDANTTLATRLLRDVLRFDPGAEPAVRRLMVLLEVAGDRLGARRVYDDFVRYLGGWRAEVSPLPETRAVAERLRVGRELVGPRGAAESARKRAAGVQAADRTTPSQTGDTERAVIGADMKQHTGAAPVATPHELPTASGRRHPLARWVAVTVGALGVAVAAAAVVRMAAASRSAAAETMVIAVGAVDDRTGTDSLGSARVLRDLLATDLGRIPGLTVVSQTRIQEVLTRLAVGDETRATLTRAARTAGAREVLEGELYQRSPGVLRLDVRRVDAGTGVIRRAYSTEGGDLFALVERLSGQLAAELGQRPPSPALAELTTPSLVARRFYEEGVRAYYQGELHGAFRLFQAALAEDSTFAMAAYFASRADPGMLLTYAAQAVRMSRRATERERLLIATRWAESTNKPAAVALAESLARRFPLEPEADLALGRALVYAGDFERAVRSFRRAIARDSMRLRPPLSHTDRQPPCTSCEAFNHLVNTYQMMDSLATAERVTGEWIRWQPQSTAAWEHLAVFLVLQGHAAAAEEAWRTRLTLSTGAPPDDAFHRATTAIRFSDFAEADRLLAERARGGGAPVRSGAHWWQAVSFRTQGRLTAARAAALRLRAALGEGDLAAMGFEAQVLFEMGHVVEAARAFERVAAAYRPAVPAGAPDSAIEIMTRHLAWYLTHAATAYAAAGDTARVARLADSLEVLGRMSAYGRDQRLHHHVRGLLLLARGQREEAAASFRRAIYSPTMGFTRTNLELGRVLLSLGRPREAISVLAPALRGDLQASNLYVTHAELHEALAQAYDAAGQRDSARVHYAWVAKAWQSADPPFRQRTARAKAEATRAG